MVSRLSGFTYCVLCLGLLCGLAILRIDVRLALLPAAFTFGWSQIAGV
jgi:hypothetical protein